jgi:6-phosphogluconolactonase
MSIREVIVLPSDEEVAQRAAPFICERVRAGVAERGAFSLALSGGRTPARMLELLGKEIDVPWEAVDVYQVDERIVPRDHPDRNLNLLEKALPNARIHPMPVDEEDLVAGEARYAESLPDRLDLVHLGLGDDGHTASLVPNCGALQVRDRDIAISREYQGCRRMTLTYPAIDGAREVLWVVTGEDKAEALKKLLSGDESIPAARVHTPVQTVFTDIPVTYPVEDAVVRADEVRRDRPERAKSRAVLRAAAPQRSTASSRSRPT